MEIDIPDINDLEFEEMCPFYWQHAPDHVCVKCDDTGVVPNEVGERLLKFLRKHRFVERKVWIR